MLILFYVLPNFVCCIIIYYLTTKSHVSLDNYIIITFFSLPNDCHKNPENKYIKKKFNHMNNFF